MDFETILSRAADLAASLHTAPLWIYAVGGLACYALGRATGPGPTPPEPEETEDERAPPPTRVHIRYETPMPRDLYGLRRELWVRTYLGVVTMAEEDHDIAIATADAARREFDERWNVANPGTAGPSVSDEIDPNLEGSHCHG